MSEEQLEKRIAELRAELENPYLEPEFREEKRERIERLRQLKEDLYGY